MPRAILRPFHAACLDADNANARPCVTRSCNFLLEIFLDAAFIYRQLVPPARKHLKLASLDDSFADVEHFPAHSRATYAPRCRRDGADAWRARPRT